MADETGDPESETAADPDAAEPTNATATDDAHATSDPLLYHVNGDLVPADEATVSVRDRGFMYGDAAFETLRAYGGEVFEWAAHADRLANSCEALSLAHGLSDADLRGRIDETLAANDLDDAYVKLSVSRGVQPGKLAPKPEVDPTVVVYVDPLPRSGRTREPVWDGHATVQTVKTRRTPTAAVPAHAKTHNYLNGILAKTELHDADEALLLDADGTVAEGATSNVFFVDDEGLHTPSLAGPVLPGITRKVVLRLARDVEVPVHEGTYRSEDVRNAREAFLTNTTWEIRPVETVDGIAVGGGPVTELLRRRFGNYVEANYY